jgi:hypothetical protein
MAKETCLRILHDTIGVKKFHLHWVSYALDTNQKADRVTLLHGILSVLQSAHYAGLQRIITGDGLWLFLHYLRDSI